MDKRNDDLGSPKDPSDPNRVIKYSGVDYDALQEKYISEMDTARNPQDLLRAISNLVDLQNDDARMAEVFRRAIGVNTQNIDKGGVAAGVDEPFLHTMHNFFARRAGLRLDREEDAPNRPNGV